MSISDLTNTAWIFNQGIPNSGSNISGTFDLSYKFGGISVDGVEATATTLQVIGYGPAGQPYLTMTVKGTSTEMYGTHSSLTPVEYASNCSWCWNGSVYNNNEVLTTM